MNPEDDDRTIIRPPGGPRTGQIPASAGAVPGTAYPPTQAMPPAAPTQTMPAARPPATSMPTSGPSAMPTSVSPTTGGPSHALTLEAGTRLGEFEVTKTIGEGGFGIVYLAWDHSLDRKVALKEYMPTSLAFRSGPTDIKPRSERHQETFEAGLKSFINEAKLLAQFDHPSLLKVYRFWEANGTAYMVMPFLEGSTVRDTVRAMGGPPSESWILGLLAPLLDALAMLHASQIYHRDIAPDNVLLLADTGRPLLLDFGAARRVIGDMTQALTAILKPGYAPVEQYADMPGLKQGPWTDVYALAAVVHWMITSKTPPPSVGRLFDDPYVPLAQSAAGRYSDAFLRAIDHALAVLPEKRTPSVEAMRAELFGDAAPVSPLPTGAGTGTAPQDVPRSQPHPRTETQTRQRVPPTSVQPPRVDEPQMPARTSPSRMPLVAGGVGLVVVAALVAFALWPKKTPPAPTPTVVTPAVAPPTASAVAASAATPAPVVVTAPPVIPAVVAPAASTATATATPETLPPRDASPTVTTPPKPVAAADPKPPVRKPPPSTTPPETRERPPAPVQARPEPKTADNSAECARIFQLISLGQADQSVMDRFRTLRCR